MSKKIASSAKVVLVFTVLGCVIPIVYINIFPVGFLIYHKLPDTVDIIAIGGLICIIGAIAGISGIFSKKIDNTDKIICSICTFFCSAFILFALSLPCTGREKAMRLSCASDLKQIHLALQQYAADYAGYYPPANGAAGLEMLRNNYYLSSHETYVCPSSSTDYSCNDIHPLTEENIDYVYIGGLNIKSDPNLPLAYDKAMNHGGYFGNVLFVDGTIKAIEGDPWTQNIRK